MEKKRYHLIDEYRGLVVINMVLYHAIWDLVFMFGNHWEWFMDDRQGWRKWIGGSFVLVSGLCWKMGRSPLKRGLLIYVCGVIVSAVTVLFVPSAAIMFGVLTLLGSSMILMVALDVIARYIPSFLGFAGSIVLFVICFEVNNGYFGMGDWVLAEVPREWYANAFTTYLGFPERGFVSADYYTLVPWFFLFAAGYFLHGMILVKENKLMKFIQSGLELSILPPLGWVGKHSLIIYMAHQPLIYGVLNLYYMWIG